MSKTDTKRLSTEELDRLRQADVSPEFMAIVRRGPETVGKQRNSTREEARKMLRTTPRDMQASEDLPVRKQGGHYFQALRRGEVGEAFFRADITNTRLMLDTFGRDYIIERMVAEGEKSPEGAARYVDEQIDRFGDGLIL